MLIYMKMLENLAIFCCIIQTNGPSFTNICDMAFPENWSR